MSERTLNDVRRFYMNKGFSGRVGFGKRPAVVVVDFIVGFTDPTSPLAADFGTTLENTLSIVQAAREYHFPVFFSTVEYDPSLRDAGLFPLKVGGLTLLITGSKWVEIDPRLARQEGELLISKRFASVFFGTSFASCLSTQSIDTLIITGCTTSGCIRATAVDALQYGFHAIVPRDAVFDRVASAHHANLLDIDAKYGDVVNTAEVLTYFKKLNLCLASTGG